MKTLLMRLAQLLKFKGVHEMAIVKKGYKKQMLFSWLILLAIVIIKPLGMNLQQSVVMGSLFMVIVWWGTGIINKNIASLYLITVFIIFGGTPIGKVLYFPLSNNVVLVVASYLLSQGIVNSKVADKFTAFVLQKYCDNSRKLVLMSFALGIALIFVIPQPFPRVILLSSIYMNLLKNVEMDQGEKMVILFSVFVGSTVTSLLFLNGDVIINNAIQGFGDVHISYLRWMRLMTVPTLIATILVAMGFLAVFKRDLKHRFDWNKASPKEKTTFSERITLAITFGVVVLWLTESIHGIGAAQVSLLGVFAMFAFQVIKMKDFKAINVGLLIFLTAEFAIGKVLVGSGIAIKLGDALLTVFPTAGHFMYFPIIIFIIMGLHMIMGSLITALSVLIPTLITLTASNVSPEVIVLLTAVSVCFHYLMPFHHVTIMLGYGGNYFENHHVIKFGVYLTGVTIVAVLLIYLPWWRLMGII